MKKLLIIILLMIITMTVQSSEIDHKEDINNIILTFQAQKITYNGVVGFFMPLQGWNNLNIILRDYFFLQDIIIIKDERIKQLEKLELINFRLKTALAITISFDIGSIFLIAGLGILCYNIAKYPTY